MTVNTVVGKKKAVEANAPIFYSKKKEPRGAKHAKLDEAMFSWLKQHLSCIGQATKVLRFAGKRGMREQLSKHREEAPLGQRMLHTANIK